MMTRTVLVAGATGAVGRPLVRLLVEAGWAVHGTTRHAHRADALRQAGVAPVVVDVFDAPALHEALARVRPDVVVHQLTDLPAVLTPSSIAAALAPNARLRSEGTRNLVDALREAGCRRVVAQSIAWAYAEGPLPHHEDDALDTAAPGARGLTVQGVRALEDQVLRTPGVQGVVLRYGRLYGPGTWTAERPAEMPLHVEDAARAAWLAVERTEAVGAFNVSEACPELSIERSSRVLGWEPALRV